MKNTYMFGILTAFIFLAVIGTAIAGPATITINTPPNATIVNGTTVVNITIVDSVGILNCSFFSNTTLLGTTNNNSADQNSFLYSWVSTGTADGRWRLNVSCTNVTEHKITEAGGQIVDVDNTRTVSITSPSASGTINGTWNFKATSNMFNTSNCTFRIDTLLISNNATTVQTNHTYFFDVRNATTLKPDGTYTINVSCMREQAPKVTSSSSVVVTGVIIDNVAPANVTMTLDNQRINYKKDSVTATCSGNDASVLSMSYTLTKPSANTETKTSSGTGSTATFTPELFDEVGQYTMTCTATDGASKTTTSSALTIDAKSASGASSIVIPQVTAQTTQKSAFGMSPLMIGGIVGGAIIIVVVLSMMMGGKKGRRRRR